MAPRAELQIAPAPVDCNRACANVAIILIGIRSPPGKRRRPCLGCRGTVWASKASIGQRRNTIVINILMRFTQYCCSIANRVADYKFLLISNDLRVVVDFARISWCSAIA